MDRGIGARAAIKAGVLGFFLGMLVPFLALVVAGALAVFFYRRDSGCCFLPRWPRGLEERRELWRSPFSRFFSPSDFRISPPAGIHRFGDAVCALGRGRRFDSRHSSQHPEPVHSGGADFTIFFVMIVAVALASAGGALGSVMMRPASLAGDTGRLTPARPLLWADPRAYDAAFMSSRTPGRPVEIHEKAQLMSASEVERTLIRLAHEILEKNNGIDDLALVGIRRRGVRWRNGWRKSFSASRRSPCWSARSTSPSTATIFPRWTPSPSYAKRNGNSHRGKSVVLVDDVLYTGRTTRAAMDALFRVGRPSACSCAC